MEFTALPPTVRTCQMSSMYGRKLQYRCTRTWYEYLCLHIGYEYSYSYEYLPPARTSSYQGDLLVQYEQEEVRVRLAHAPLLLSRRLRSDACETRAKQRIAYDGTSTVRRRTC